MSVKYHISPESGRPNICRAQSIDSCPLKGEEGQPAKHFDNKDEAKAYVEGKLTEEHGETKTVSRKRKVLSRDKTKDYANLSEVQLAKEINQLELKTDMFYNNNNKYSNDLNSIAVARELAESLDYKTALDFLKERNVDYWYHGIDSKEKFFNEIYSLEEDIFKERKENNKNLVDNVVDQKTARNELGRRLKEQAIKNTQKVELNVPQELVLSDNYNYEVPSRISVEGGGYGGNAWVGSKASDKGYRPITDIAKDVRQDIKEATAGGYLPKGFKYSVKVDKYAGGASLNVSIYDENSDIRNTHEFDPSFNSLRLKPEYRKFQDRVETLVEAYNAQDNNGQIDYFNTSFYGHSRFEEMSQVAFRKHDSERLKFNKFLNSKKDTENLDQDPEFLEKEASYYNSLNEYFQKVEYNNAVYNDTSKKKRMLTDEEFDDLKSSARTKAAEKVTLTKERNLKQNRRFSTRS